MITKTNNNTETDPENNEGMNVDDKDTETSPEENEGMNVDDKDSEKRHQAS